MKTVFWKTALMAALIVAGADIGADPAYASDIMGEQAVQQTPKQDWVIHPAQVEPAAGANEPVVLIPLETSQTQSPMVSTAPVTDMDLEKGVAVAENGTRDTLNVAVISWRDLPFRTVKRQTFDYSCGSAAVATLLTYVYGEKTAEDAVFKAMFEAGDKEKIRTEGFSLQDMSLYLQRRGYNAEGYRIDYDAIKKSQVPFIALINNEGYNHFVVVKSLGGGLVLVGDPNKGNVIYSREEFLRLWNGIALIVMNHARKARALFTDGKEWGYARPKALASIGERPGLGMDSVNLPFTNWQIAPVTTDL
ncbi:MAG: C39 family peptidase, partial [Alphaproteobacteria bacterium]|nr:C39 family peptidase [Alphaproteobacteria bacterium]